LFHKRTGQVLTLVERGGQAGSPAIIRDPQTVIGQLLNLIVEIIRDFN
jgi:hypothetical protein